MTPLAIRFWKYVQKSDGCWTWTGYCNRYGYGRIGLGSRIDKMESAHRVSWMLTYGPIAPGEWILHHCDNPPCVRPDHLFKGDHASNMEDRQKKGRQPQGEGHGMAKLTSSQVSEIRGRLDAGEMGSRLAMEYGVGKMQISRIKNNLRWQGYR